MQIEELHWFTVLCETENVGRAAAELGLSQPGLSRALARLEAEIGAPLFDRKGRVLTLNRYGEAYLAHARRVLGEAEAGRRAVAELASPESGTVAMAFLHTVGTWLVPRLLLSFRAEYPGVRFQLIQGGSATNLAALERGEVDLAITSPRPAGPKLAWRSLRRERLYLAVPVGHRFAQRRRVRLTEAAAETFVANKPGTGLRESSEELWREAGITPAIAFEGDDVATLRGMVAVGLGVAVLPRARTYDGGVDHGGDPWLRYVPLAGTGGSRELGLVWRADRWASPAVAAFRESVLATAPELP
ncbi:MAG TPA: LysR family transcriptional regulator [Actinocrinis sp.]|uniref:LysR family transcriptional regulator n=1 Tax=Actinocrinis sp. TaxID=1920516 RepID=UPI002DDCDF58|nr:LysR family transcriptional regulator [Actinocrinis sp.]HEV2346121.1 LysR family transcriptional regulator [Actinocrinis sp.]